MIQIQSSKSPVPVGILATVFSFGAAGEVVFDAGAGEEGAVAADDGPFEEEGGGAGCLSGREAGAGGVAVKAV